MGGGRERVGVTDRRERVQEKDRERGSGRRERDSEREIIER